MTGLHSNAEDPNGGDPASPKLAPWYWAVKEGSPELRARFRALTAVPYFLPGGEPNTGVF